MFAVIYRSYILPNKEAEYKSFWRQIANHFVQHRGALGSNLHKTEAGYWLAYSVWPDRETRDASWPGEGDVPEDLPEEIRHAIYGVKGCLDDKEAFPEICMNLVDGTLYDSVN